jgi:hypothetical protein
LGRAFCAILGRAVVGIKFCFGSFVNLSIFATL